jgi:hypothetical protein
MRSSQILRELPHSSPGGSPGRTMDRDEMEEEESRGSLR